MNRVSRIELIDIIAYVKDGFDCMYVLGDDPQIAKSMALELLSSRKRIEEMKPFVEVCASLDPPDWCVCDGDKKHNRGSSCLARVLLSEINREDK